MIPLSIVVFERGAGGAPSTVSKIGDLAGLVSSYEHSISDRFGFESMQISMPCDVDTAMEWLQNGLMRSVVVYGPDGETVWEGYLETIAATVGQKRATLSVKNVANWVKGTHTTGGTTYTTAIQESATSQAIYGLKQLILNLGEVYFDGALYAAQRALAQLAWPRSEESTEAKTGAPGDLSLELTFAGWYATLDWVFVPTAYTPTPLFAGNTVVDPRTQINELLAYAYTDNAYIPFNSTEIPTFGFSINNFVPFETTYKAAIETYPPMGTSSNQSLAWGVYDNRTFRVAVSAANTPTTIGYYEDARTGAIHDAMGNTIAPWSVRPNVMSEIVQLLDVAPPTGAVDASARKYVSRVSCRISGDEIGCTLEPLGGGSLERMITAFGSGVRSVRV